MKIESILLGVYLTNTYVVYDEQSRDAFVVDPAMPSPKLEKLLKERQLTPKYIILTHGHGDHTGGIDQLKTLYKDIKLVACKNEAKFLYDRKYSQGKGGIAADLEVSDGDCLEVGGMKLEFIETPGHTPGGMCIKLEDVLFSGDTLFCESIGRTDFPGGSTEKLMRSVKMLLETLPEETRVFPGHDAATTIGHEKRYNPFV